MDKMRAQKGSRFIPKETSGSIGLEPDDVETYVCNATTLRERLLQLEPRFLLR